MITADEKNILLKRLREFQEKIDQKYFTWPTSAANLVDCVLSLNRKYESFAKPRVQNFILKFPEITSIKQLHKAISKYSSRRQFGIDHFDYDHEQRVDMVYHLCIYLIEEIGPSNDVASEFEKLKLWADNVRPGDSYFLGIKGFGLSGFQYLRMLFGAKTTKPDVHIIRFVSEQLERNVSDIQALYYLEKTVELDPTLNLREIEYQIWKESSEK